MARYEYDGAKVQSALFSLQAASNALNGIEADLSSAISKIEQEVAQRGMGQIEVPRDAIVAAPGEAQSMISQLLGLISDKDAQLAEYFNKSSIGRFFYSVGMGITNVAEGIGIAGEGLIDGAATIVGWGAGLFGADDLQNDISNWIEKDQVSSWFDSQYEEGIFKDLELYSTYSHDSGFANVLKGVGTAAGYVGLGFLTGGSVLADVGFSALGGLGTETQRGLQSGQSFGQASITGIKGAALNAAAAAGGNWLGGKVANKISGSKVAAKAGESITEKANLVSSRLGSSSDDVVSAVTKTANKTDDVARAATKAGTKADDAASVATKARNASDGVENVTSRGDEVVKAADELNTAEKALNEGNIKYKNGEITEGDLGKLEEARDIARTNYEKVGGNSDELIDASNKLNKSEELLNQGNAKYKNGEITEGDLGKLEEARDAARTNYKDTITKTANKTDDIANAATKAETQNVQARTTGESGNISSKAKMDVTDDGIAARNLTRESTNGSKYDLSEIAKEGPIMRDHEGASSIAKAVDNSTNGSKYDLSEIAKEGPIMRDHEGASSIAKAVDNSTNGSKYDLSEIAKEGPIMRDHEGASSIVNAANKTDDIANAATKAEMDVTDNGIAARKASDGVENVTSRGDEVVKAADDLNTAEKALNEGNIKYKNGEITEGDLGKLEEARDIARTNYEKVGGNSDELIDASNKLNKSEELLNQGNAKYKNGEITEGDLGKLEEARDAARTNYKDAITKTANKTDDIARNASEGIKNAASKGDEIMDASYRVLDDNIGARNIGSAVGVGTEQAAINISNQEPNRFEVAMNDLDLNYETTDDVVNIVPSDGETEVSLDTTDSGSSGTYTGNTGGGSPVNTGTYGPSTTSTIQARTEVPNNPTISDNISTNTNDLSTPSETSPIEIPTDESNNNTTIEDTTITEEPTIDSPTTEPNDNNMSGDITITEEPTIETPTITNPGESSSNNPVLDNITNIRPNNNQPSNGGNYTGSVTNGLDSFLDGQGDKGELSYENKPGVEIEQTPSLGDLTSEDNELDVISVGNTGTDKSGGSVIPAILGTGVAAAAGAAGIHYIKNKKDQNSQENEYDDENDYDNTTDNSSQELGLEETEDDYQISNEIQTETPKYKAGTINKLVLDDGENVKINEDASIIAPKNSELE